MTEFFHESFFFLVKIEEKRRERRSIVRSVSSVTGKGSKIQGSRTILRPMKMRIRAKP